MEVRHEDSFLDPSSPTRPFPRRAALWEPAMSGLLPALPRRLPDGIGGRYVGRYRGLLFRSLFEYSFLRWLEGEGGDLAEVVQEPFGVPYQVRGKARTYWPDYLLRGPGVLVEVKSDREMGRRRGRRVRDAKFAAATTYCDGAGLSFVVLTQGAFPVIPTAEALVDPLVEWLRRGSKRKKKR